MTKAPGCQILGKLAARIRSSTETLSWLFFSLLLQVFFLDCWGASLDDGSGVTSCCPFGLNFSAVLKRHCLHWRRNCNYTGTIFPTFCCRHVPLLFSISIRPDCWGYLLGNGWGNKSTLGGASEEESFEVNSIMLASNSSYSRRITGYSKAQSA